MNRFTAKLVHGFTRLVFWRKPAATTLEEPEPLAAPEPETAHQSKRIEAESSAVADAPVQQASWFARLKLALLRRQPAAQEETTDPDQAVAMERPSRKQDDASTTAEDLPAPKPSLLARLKSKFRRPPEHVQPEADEDTPRSREVEPATDEEAVHVSRIQHVRAVLTNKWVWVPGISVMLIAIIATMMWMLVQSGHDKKQLQLELVATQKKLKLANAAKAVAIKPVVAHPGVHEQAGNPAVVAAGSQSGIDAGGCDVSNKENVTQNLKNCIDSFNAMAE